MSTTIKIIPHYPPKPLWETLGMAENPSKQHKMSSLSPPKRSSFINSHLPLLKLSFLPPSNSNFHLSPYTSFIYSCSHCCCIYIYIFFNLGFMYAQVMLILINQCLLNVGFSMAKAFE